MIGDDISRDIHHKQYEEQARYGSDALCQGIQGHALCASCQRLAPGQKSPKHFINPPATDQKKCRCFKR